MRFENERKMGVKDFDTSNKSAFWIALTSPLNQILQLSLFSTLTSFQVLRTPKSWLKYFFGCFQPFCDFRCL